MFHSKAYAKFLREYVQRLGGKIELLNRYFASFFFL